MHWSGLHWLAIFIVLLFTSTQTKMDQYSVNITETMITVYAAEMSGATEGYYKFNIITIFLVLHY